MRILIIGGSGFLRSEMSKRLLSDGNEVRSLSRGISSLTGINVFHGDISVPTSYREMISSWQPEIVIQGAWVTEQKSYRESPNNELYYKSTLNLAEHCFRSNTKHFIGLGSSAEYGHQEDPCDAAVTKPNPQDSYGKHKLSTFERLRELANSYSGKLIWARIFQPYGPGQDNSRLLPSSLRKLASWEKVSIHNTEVVLDWKSSRDIASSLAYVIDHDLPEIVDIGISIGISVGEVIRKLSILIGADSNLVSFSPGLSPSQCRLKLVVSQNSPILKDGWAPQDNLDSGLVWTLSL